MNTGTWDLAELRKYYKGWVKADDSSLFRDRPREELPALIAEPSDFPTLGKIASALGHIALWENSYGIHCILEGEEAGWARMALAVRFQEWQLRIQRFRFAKLLATRGRVLHLSEVPGELSRAFAQAVALKIDSVADWCGQVMLDELSAPTGFLQEWDQSPFHDFMAWLYAKWQGQALPECLGSERDYGAYEPFVRGWESDTSVKKALLQACNYHCLRSDGDVDCEAEFWHTPFDIFPGEMLAILRLRQILTGTVVKVDHPLLQSPVCRVPEAISPSDDPLFEELANRLSQAESRK